jgi:D-glycero-alpha-D-manno-heptose-7-phosphate kinase
MILTRTPLRVSFAGGGSDLAEFYRRHTGVVVSTAIKQAMYIAIHPYFHDKIRIKYSRIEDVSNVAEITHPIVRECLRTVGIERGVEIASFADVPAGTGMGSSSAFTVGLLNAVYARTGRTFSPAVLAAAACDIEITRLGEPIGKQDQYAVAFGGINRIRFLADDRVDVHPVACSSATRAELEKRLMLFYTGADRSAGPILSEQSRNMQDPAKFKQVVEMAALAEDACCALEQGDLEWFASILDQGWRLKSSLANGITNEMIDLVYRRAREAGANGGKLLGAGGGGFLLLSCPVDKQQFVRQALGQLRELPFGISEEGSSVLFNDG